MVPAPDPADVPASIAAWQHTYEAVLALTADLPNTGWQAPTECPGWTVKDVCAHLVGGELWMSAGHPPHEEGLAAIADGPVAARRPTPGRAVRAELADLLPRRLAELAADPPDPAVPTLTAFGARVTVGVLLTHRAFDFWVHEQDIRRALGVPGNLDSPAARMSAAVFATALPRVVAKLAAASPGATVRVTVDGPVAFDVAVTVDPAGRGGLTPWADAGEPTVHLRAGWERYARLAAGRIPPAAADVRVTGDVGLGERVLANFAVTP